MAFLACVWLCLQAIDPEMLTLWERPELAEATGEAWGWVDL